MICAFSSALMRGVQVSPPAAPPCVPTALHLVKHDSCHCCNLLNIWHTPTSSNWHLYRMGSGSFDERTIGDREREWDNNILLCHVGVITLFSLSLWLHFKGDLDILKRICSRKKGIRVVWENAITFFLLLFFTSPISTFPVFGLYLSYLSSFYKWLPPLRRK